MAINTLTTPNYNMNQTSFRANPTKKPSTFISLSARAAVGTKKTQELYDSFIEKVVAKKLVAPIINSKFVSKLADKTSKIKGMTDHMATAGSFVTTATYAGGTLTNKNLEKKPARTLALNQVLVTALSTVGAYTINDWMGNITKNMSYKFRDANMNHPNLERRVQGFKIAQKLLTFSLMYRYVAPVLVTPVASKIGKALNNNNPHQKAQKVNVEQSQAPKAKMASKVNA